MKSPIPFYNSWIFKVRFPALILRLPIFSYPWPFFWRFQAAAFVMLIIQLQSAGQVYAQPLASSGSLLNQKSLQLSFGTQGLGLEFNYGILPDLALSVGGNVIPLKANNIFEISGLNSTSEVSANFYNLHLMADYSPVKAVRWFRLVGGFAYFFEANGGLTIYPSDRYTYGDLVLNQDQIGYVDLNVDWKGLAPYLGVGFAGIFPRGIFNVNFDLGSYLLNRPEANIIGTGILSGNSSQSAQLQSNIKNYRWLPVLQVNFNLKL